MWRLWLQGENDEPDICKACLRSLRRWYPDKKIITLNQNNLSDYIALPDYIEDKYKHGYISHTHYSDLVRLQLLTRYGGIWIDSTVYCTGRKFESILDQPLFVFQQKTRTIIASSWFIVSHANDPILSLTKELQFRYWQDYDYLMHYFVFHLFFQMAAEVYKDEWDKVPFMSNQPPHYMQRTMHDDYSDEKMRQLAENSDFHKLTYKFDPMKVTPTSILQHIINS